MNHNDPMAAAFHEAGHVVAAHTLGRRIVGVWLFSAPHEGHNATTSISNVLANQRARRRRDVVIALAGGLAEERYRQTALHPLAASEDYEMAAREIASLSMWDGVTPTEAIIEAGLTAAEAEASRILEQRWPDVVRVANALFERRYLSGATIRRLIGHGQGNKGAT